jgi:U2-associated protein SR140
VRVAPIPPSLRSQSSPLPDLLDEDDSTTTNLYLSNLSSMVTEELLYEIFRKFGEINSIKIMWPRSEDEKFRKRNCGFVSFKHRSDASDAIVSQSHSFLLSYLSLSR